MSYTVERTRKTEPIPGWLTSSLLQLTCKSLISLRVVAINVFPLSDHVAEANAAAVQSWLQVEISQRHGGSIKNKTGRTIIFARFPFHATLLNEVSKTG